MSHSEVAEVPSHIPALLPKRKICVVCGKLLAKANSNQWCFRHTTDEVEVAQVKIGEEKRHLGPPRQRLHVHGEVALPVKSGNPALTKKVVRITKMSDIRKIIRLVRRHFNLKWHKFPRMRTREPKFVKARYILMYLLYKDTPLTMANIGILLGRMNHATVVYGVKKIKNQFQSDPQLRGTLNALRNRYPRP